MESILLQLAEKADWALPILARCLAGSTVLLVCLQIGGLLSPKYDSVIEWLALCAGVYAPLGMCLLYVFHVDSIVFDNKILFALSSRYHKPPFDVWNGGGVFATQTVDPKHPAYQGLLDANEQVIKAMRLVRGVTHAEFIRAQDGTIYFLEMAARVGGAHIDRLVEAASGVNPWKEWPRLELAYLKKEKYKLPKIKKNQAGLVICLSRHEHPDLTHYNAPEVVWKMSEEFHAAVIVSSPKSIRVDELLDQYTGQLTNDVLAVAPPTETALH